MSSTLDFALLRSFLAVVEARSITLAAPTLGLTQPAISKQLAALERHFGQRLLHRDGRGVRPTRAGQLLAERARTIVRRLEAIETGTAAEPDRDVVRVGLSPTVAEMAVVPLLRHIAGTHPDIRLAVSDGFSGHVAEWLRAGTIDVGVLYAGGDMRGFGVVATFSEVLHLVVPADQPGFDDNRARAVDLADLTFVLPGRPHGLRMTAEALFRAHDVPLSVGYEIASFPTIRRLVAEGLASTILPWRAVAADVRAGRMRAIVVEDMPMVRALAVAVADAADTPLAVRDVADALAAILDLELAIDASHPAGH
jgi:LysR family nitrogen assimilation transcriptional regulator